jgi:two-component system, NarL family, response regulator
LSLRYFPIPIKMKKLKLLLVDDHPAFRLGVATALMEEPDFSVIGQASTGAEALHLAKETLPDIVLLDLRLPDMSGVECAAGIRLCSASSRIIILTTFDHDHDLATALREGVSAYLLKDCSLTDICRTIREVANGKTMVSPKLEQRALLELQREPLSPRENEVLQCVVKGFSNKETATNLGISEETVKSHIKTLLRKLGVMDRTQAAIAALRRGLVG